MPETFLLCRCIEVPFDEKTFKVDLKAVRRALSRNTIMLFGSAISYPHGVMDNIEELSVGAAKHGKCLIYNGMCRALRAATLSCFLSLPSHIPTG